MDLYLHPVQYLFSLVLLAWSWSPLVWRITEQTWKQRIDNLEQTLENFFSSFLTFWTNKLERLSPARLSILGLHLWVKHELKFYLFYHIRLWPYRKIIGSTERPHQGHKHSSLFAEASVTKKCFDVICTCSQRASSSLLIFKILNCFDFCWVGVT